MIALTFISASWAMLAAYVGMAAFLAASVGAWWRWVFAFTALVILGTTAVFLLNPYTFDVFYRYRILLSHGRYFWTASFLLNTGFGSGMLLSLIDSRRLPAKARGFARVVSGLAVVCAMPWIMQPGLGGGIFIARFYVRNSEFATSRLIFTLLFAGIAIAAFLRMKALYKLGVSS